MSSTRSISIALMMMMMMTVIVACGPSTPGSSVRPSGSMSTRSADQANVAVQAVDPRMGDATASGPPPSNLGPGKSANLNPAGGNSFMPSQSSSAQPPPSTIGVSPKTSGDDGPGSGSGPAASSSSDPPPSSPPTAKKVAEPPKKIGARHVLIQWMGSERAPASVVRSRDQALAVAQQVLKRAKAGDDFARLAVEFSDEPGAGNRGGSLGRFGRGQMVGAFENAAFKLEVNQISDIVESPFGFHIIQRTE